MDGEVALGADGVVRFVPSDEAGSLSLEIEVERGRVDVPVEDAVGLLDQLGLRIEEALA